MKKFSTAILLTSISLSAMASDYAKLAASKRNMIEAKLNEFIPQLNSAAVGALQELMSKAKKPLRPKDRLLDVELEGITWSGILSQQSAIYDLEVPMFFRDGMYFYELLSITAAGIEIGEILESKSEWDYENYLRALDKELTVEDDSKEGTWVMIDRLGFPYCNT